MSQPEPHLSVVIPVFRNADTISELYQRLDKVLTDYEIIFVNDGCSNSKDPLNQLAKKSSKIKVLNNEKNQGQNIAILLGIRQAKGQNVVIMDADLQDHPEAIPKLISKLDEGYDAVFAGRRGIYQSFLRLATSKSYKFGIHLLSGVPVDAGIFLIMSKDTVRQVLKFKQPYVIPAIGLSKLKITSIPVERSKRLEGSSAYSSWKRLKIGTKIVTWTLINKLKS